MSPAVPATAVPATAVHATPGAVAGVLGRAGFSPSTYEATVESLRAGQIDINGGAFNINAPFGGFKQSGRGRELGKYGLEEFLEYKSLQTRAPKAA